MALLFDAVDQVDHGDINAIDGAAVLSWMCWTKPDGTTSVPGITKNLLFPLYATGGSKWASGESGVWERASTASVSAGAWLFYAGTYDGSLAAASRFKMYLNGVLETTTGSDPGATLPSSAVGLLTGRNTTGVGAGSMALVKIYTAVLTATEVLQEMNSYRPARTANLILWSPYDDGVSSRDYSGVGNHGTVTGAVQAQGPPVAQGGR